MKKEHMECAIYMCSKLQVDFLEKIMIANIETNIGAKRISTVSYHVKLKDLHNSQMLKSLFGI